MDFGIPLLTRRRAAGFLVAYTAAAWVVIQVAAVVSPHLGLPAWVPSAVITAVVVALPLILLAYIFAVPWLAPRYIDQQIDAAAGAKGTLLLCVHSLQPAAADPRIFKLQQALGRAKARNVDVRLLTPGGVDRVEAAFELAITHGVPIRIVAELEDQDLRFTIVDGSTVIISHQPRRDKGLSKTFSRLESQRLHAILGAYFEQLWMSAKSQSFDDYVTALASELGMKSDPVSIERVAARLGISPVYLQKLSVARGATRAVPSC